MNSPLLSMNFIRTFLFAAAITLLAAVRPGWAETAQTAGSLDETFDPNVTGGEGFLYATAVQSDGKIIIGGNFASVGKAARQYLARLNADGSVDASFTASTDWEVYCVAVQADGKILVGGQFAKVNDTPHSCIARLNENGILDDSFNPYVDSTVYCLAVQADGRIVLGGEFSSPHSHIARLDENGNVDESFDPGTGVNTGVLSVAVQPDEKIVLGGDFTIPHNRIARLKPDGKVDPDFHPGTGANALVYCVALQADGKIVLGGYFTKVNNTPRENIARLDKNGSPESPAPFSAGGHVWSVAIQTDGKIVLGGGFGGGIQRLEAGWSVDKGFNPGAGANAAVRSVAMQADGKIVLGGDFTTVNGTRRNAIARLNNDAATQTLTLESTRLQWTRGGAGPEVSQVTFERITDGGSTWTLLGKGTRIGSNWELKDVKLPETVSFRARGRADGGAMNGSPGLIESSGLMKLREGNQRYAIGWPTHPNQSKERRTEVAEGQHPFAVIVGCADSRVPPEILFDQGLGDLFVIRVAGEVPDDSVLGSIEYAVEHLHTPLIVVLGHESCGAVDAAMHYDPHPSTPPDAHHKIPKHVEELLAKIKENIKGTTVLEKAVQQNATKAAEQIRKDLDEEELDEVKGVSIVTGYYNLHSGAVTFYK